MGVRAAVTGAVRATVVELLCTFVDACFCWAGVAAFFAGCSGACFWTCFGALAAFFVPEDGCVAGFTERCPVDTEAP